MRKLKSADSPPAANGINQHRRFEENSLWENLELAYVKWWKNCVAKQNRENQAKRKNPGRPKKVVGEA